MSRLEVPATPHPENQAVTARNVTWPAVGAVAWREIVRFFRQRNRVVGAVATPLVFWLLLGVGLNDVFHVPPGGTEAPEAAASSVVRGGEPRGYLAYFFPGMVVMVLLFTSIFSTITVIDDRNNGFLQGVLASPATRWAVVLGNVLGGAAIATLQGLLLLPIWYVFFAGAPTTPPEIAGLLLAVAVMFVMSVGLTAMGLFFAWPMDSTAGYHAVMNLVQFPMWFLCGAVFPLATAGVLKWVMYANPLTYGYASLARALGAGDPAGTGLPLWATLAILLAATAAALALTTRRATQRSRS